MRWSVSWHPEGRCDTFSRSAILACAPPVSGVYGLFNFDYQVFIGEAANIQEALLRHESETNAQPAHLRPSGFTFEPCTAELRKRKADELIAIFRPVLQLQPRLRENARKRSVTSLRTAVMRRTGAEHGDQQEFPLVEQTAIAAREPWRFTFRHAAVAVVFAGAAVAILYLGARAGNNDNQSVDTASTVQATAATEARSAIEPSFEPATESGSAGGAQTAAAEKKWSVQLAAVPDKDVADRMARKLTENGYDGYVVRADVKGQIFYRVRVGHFDGRQEAESLRQALAREPEHQHAFLAQ